MHWQTGDAHDPIRPASDAGGETSSRLAARAYRPTRIEIDEALRRNWLEIWYQPKIDLQRKCLAGAEALARIRHPELGVLLPHAFIPSGSEESLAHLTEHALLTALRDWTLFDAAGVNLHLAVNLPVEALLRLPIAQLVEENRPSADNWPGLILEVTEDQIVRDLALTQQVATQLRISGVTVAIDDFGAGYSSFSSLPELVFAELKIDYGFVKNCALESANAAICQTAIDLAHRFAGAAVAEGIEDSADLHALQAMGCGQGVLLAPPMPMDDFLDLLRQRFNRPNPASTAGQRTALPPATGVDYVA